MYQLGRTRRQAGELEEARALGEEPAALAERIDSARLASQAAGLR